MSKREDAKEILKSLGLPKPQQNERSCLTLLALAELSEGDPWTDVKQPLRSISRTSIIAAFTLPSRRRWLSSLASRIMFGRLPSCYRP